MKMREKSGTTQWQSTCGVFQVNFSGIDEVKRGRDLAKDRFEFSHMMISNKLTSSGHRIEHTESNPAPCKLRRSVWTPTFF